MFDLKVINSVLGELEDERGIPREKVIGAIEAALATAYKKEYGKRGQDIRAKLDLSTGATEFMQVKTVVDEHTVRFEEEGDEEEVRKPAMKTEKVEESVGVPVEELLPRYDPEKHILLADAKFIKKDAKVGDELVFPLEGKEDYGRIAAQTAKQVIIQKIREAEKVSVVAEFGKRQGEIVSGTVQRIERGNLYIDLGRATGILPYEEQIQGERYRQGERIRALLYQVEDSPRGVYLRLSRAHPQFLAKLFEMEAPEVAHGTVVVKSIAREAGSRSKIAVASVDPHVDPVGSLVGQRGVRVSTVTSELGGEKIDIIEWSEDPKAYIEEALSPARVISVDIAEEARRATVTVTDDQQSLAIGRGGQNVRLAAKLTGWSIDIKGARGEEVAAANKEGTLVEEEPAAAE
ncbi:MAG: transcription termination/antitermination protein NusA [Patescibacteria group bacterium]|nr:transcription termination/antitermination protein NusA [Patescibacteria group bacterium]